MADGYNLMDWAQNSLFGSRPVKQTSPTLTQNLLGSIAPQSTNDMINNATMTQASRDAQSQQALAQTQGLINNIQNDVQKSRTVQGLLGNDISMQQIQNSMLLDRFSNILDGTKAQYADAQASGDEQGMNDAHARAEIIRKGAKDMGLDIDAYDTDKTREQVAAYNDLRHLKDYQAILSMPDSGQYYDQIYQQAIGAGMSKNGARDYAASRAQNYQAQRLASLNTALYYMGGLKDGAITNDGAYIMQLMRDENPDSITLPNAYYAKPINEYTFTRGEQAKDNAFNRQWQNAEHGENLQERYADRTTQNKMQLMDRDTANKGTLIRAEQDAKEHGMRTQAEIQAYIASKYPNLTAAKNSARTSSAEKGTNNNGNSGSNSKGMSVSDARGLLKDQQEWNEEHPGQEWAYPELNAAEKAHDVLNGYGSHDMDNYNSASSAAQDVLEEAARNGKPYSAVQLGQMIESLGGYGKQIAQEWMDSGRLYEYSNGKWE